MSDDDGLSRDLAELRRALRGLGRAIYDARGQLAFMVGLVWLVILAFALFGWMTP